VATLADTDLDSHKAEGTGWWRASDDPRATHPEAMTSPWAEGPWCWVLAEPRAFAKPVPWKGQQNLLEVGRAGWRGWRVWELNQAMGSAAEGSGFLRERIESLDLSPHDETVVPGPSSDLSWVTTSRG
jgi:hypothetical protein